MNSLFKLSIIAIILIASYHQGNCQPFTTKVLATGLDVPWEIKWAPDNQIYVTERTGKVLTINPSNGTKTTLFTVPNVSKDGEAGLLGMELGPFNANMVSEIYLAFTFKSGGVYMNQVVRYALSGPSAWLLRDTIVQPYLSNNFHAGSRISWGPDGKLYITTGDRGAQETPQDKSSLNGKVLRINADGTIPNDNPDPTSPIYAFGLRNPQGLVWNGNKLYSSDHGPNTDDEVNIIKRNGNYGWPNVHGFCDLPSEMTFCQNNNVVQPMIAFTPTLAVAGLDYYPANGNIIPFKNKLLLTSLKAKNLLVLGFENDTTVSVALDTFGNEYGRLRDLCISPDGRVFISTSNRDGRGTASMEDDRIIELTSTTLSANLQVVNNTSLKVYPQPATDQLTVNGIKPGSTLNLLTATGTLVWAELATNSSLSMPVSTFPSGIYILKSISGSEVVHTKVILAKP